MGTEFDDCPFQSFISRSICQIEVIFPKKIITHRKSRTTSASDSTRKSRDPKFSSEATFLDREESPKPEFIYNARPQVELVIQASSQHSLSICHESCWFFGPVFFSSNRSVLCFGLVENSGSAPSSGRR